MFEEDTSSKTVVTTAPAFSRTAGIILGVALVAVAVGGFLWVNRIQSQINTKLDQQVADLQQKTQEQAANITALQGALHMSSSELARLSSTTTDVQKRISAAATQLADAQRQASTLAQAQQQTASDLASVKQDAGTQFGTINGQLTGVKTDVTGAKTEIAKTEADLEATKASLKSAIGDLGVQSGLIATTRGELDSLEKSGQRAYAEFKLTKTKTPVRVGPISLQLQKVDAKHDKYTVDVIADDNKIEKKDKTLNEPVQFYVGNNHSLNELVVYQMSKDQIVGYISSPKYPSQAAPGATQVPGPATGAGSGSMR